MPLQDSDIFLVNGVPAVHTSTVEYTTVREVIGNPEKTEFLFPRDGWDVSNIVFPSPFELETYTTYQSDANGNRIGTAEGKLYNLTYQSGSSVYIESSWITQSSPSQWTATGYFTFVFPGDYTKSAGVQAQNLFKNNRFNDAIVLVNEGAKSYKCKVEDLPTKASDSRYMLVNSYPNTTPQIGPITDTGEITGIDYALYTTIWDQQNDTEYTENIQQQTGTFNDVYDGNDQTYCFRFTNLAWLAFRLTLPEPIVVEGEIEVKAGFALNATGGPIGELLINGEVVRELYAWSEEPQWFSAPYSGEISTIQIQQKNVDPANNAKMFVVNAFKIDGEYLISNQQVTYLDFADSKGFDKFRYNDRIKECDIDGNLLDATGTVGEVLPTQNRITLLKKEPNWNVGNYVQGRLQNDTSGDASKSYKIKSSTVVAEYSNPRAPQIGPITATGLTTGVRYEPYTKCIDIDTGLEYTGPWDQFAKGSAADVFDGTDNNYWAMNAVYNMAPKNLKFSFIPPTPITVEGLVEVFCGFGRSSGNEPYGSMYINDEPVLSGVYAWDQEPKWFSVTYSGKITKIELYADTLPFGGKVITVGAFKIDGEYLISGQQATYLDFADNTDFDKFSYNDHIKECDIDGTLLDATGTVGEVLPDQNRITLLKQEPNWNVGNYVQGRLQNDTSGDASKSYKIKSSTVVAQYGSLTAEVDPTIEEPSY